MVSQTTSTLETQAILLNTPSACRRSLYSKRTWSSVFNLYQAFLLYQHTLERKGDEYVHPIAGSGYKGCATKLMGVCVDTGISETLCNTETWQCSSSSSSGCTRNLRAKRKPLLTGSVRTQHSYSNLLKVNLGSGHKLYNFSPFLHLLS